MTAERVPAEDLEQLRAETLRLVNLARHAFGAGELDALPGGRYEPLSDTDPVVQALWPCGVRRQYLGGAECLEESAEQLCAAWGFAPSYISRSAQPDALPIVTMPTAIELYLRRVEGQEG